MSQAQMAQRLDIAPDTLVQWHKRGLPGRKKGGRWVWDLEAVDAWIEANVKVPKSDPRRADADMRKATALAELRELELAKRRGEVISRAEVRDAVGALGGMLRRRLLVLPGQLSQMCEGKSAAEIERILSGEVRQLLTIASSTPYAEVAPVLCEECGRQAARSNVA